VITAAPQAQPLCRRHAPLLSFKRIDVVLLTTESIIILELKTQSGTEVSDSVKSSWIPLTRLGIICLREGSPMPQQEVFFEQSVGERRIEVLKTYDPNFAREAFDCMDGDAQTLLWNSLGISETYDADDAPSLTDPDASDFLWDELLDGAREDGTLLSFFVVNEAKGSSSETLYVSPDWPSAEAFAKKRIATVQ
jgi:hypothetical protein